MNIKCRGEDCPNKNSCKRYLCEENKPQCWFVHSPLYSDGTCHFFVQAEEEETYRYKVVIFKTRKDYQIGILDHILEEKYYDEHGVAWDNIIPFESVEQYLYLIDQ
jgi:hypothetical protein